MRTASVDKTRTKAKQASQTIISVKAISCRKKRRGHSRTEKMSNSESENVETAMEVSLSSSTSTSPSSSQVDKVAIATKHPGVFLETSELAAETGVPLKPWVEPLQVKVRSKRRTKTTPSQSSASEEEVVVSEAASATETSEKGLEMEIVAKEGEEVVVAVNKEVEETEKSETPKESQTEEETKNVTMEQEEDVKPSEPSQGEGDEIKDDAEKPKETPAVNTRSKKSQKSVSTTSVTDKPEDIFLSEAESETSIDAREDQKEEKDDLESLESGSTVATRPSLRPKSDREGGGKKHASFVASKRSKAMQAKIRSKLAANTKGKSRRNIFKKSTTKAPLAVARAVTSDRVFYKGQCFTRGDIVSCLDVDGGTYYAQLRGFLTDQYCEKSGVITWLLPTTNSPPPEEGFDPSTYVIGPEEELPRKLEFFTFVMHAPDDYFFYRSAPYPTRNIYRDQEFLITRAGPKVRLIKDGRTVIYKDT